jgi:hypothetical protein
MAYNDLRAYTDSQPAALNMICTGSSQVMTGTVNTFMLTNEPTFIVSIAAGVTATPTGFPAGVKYYVVAGTTTIGSVSPTQAAGSGALSLINPPVAVGSATLLTSFVVATGTASATQTAGAVYLQVGMAPQFV